MSSSGDKVIAFTRSEVPTKGTLKSRPHKQRIIERFRRGLADGSAYTQAPHHPSCVELIPNTDVVQCGSHTPDTWFSNPQCYI